MAHPRFEHIPVLANESVAALAIKAGGVYVDGTVGGAGHSSMILEALCVDGRGIGSKLIGIDRDETAAAVAEKRLKELNGALGGQVECEIVHANFADIDIILDNLGISAVDGFLLDIGVSSHQFDEPMRGFSYRNDAPLDMRMDRTVGVCAADIVNGCSERELTKIIGEYGEERWAARISAFIVERRAKKPILTTVDLTETILAAVPKAARDDRVHPARRTYQGLRIAVNNELTALSTFLDKAVRLVKPGGRVCVISFHSLEDRIVKDKFRELSAGCVCPKYLPVCVCGHKASLSIVTRKPIQASEFEKEENPRARSAKLRVAERILEI
jgi:16S rRNA (cytosine1402-N4)-methyltransferase